MRKSSWLHRLLGAALLLLTLTPVYRLLDQPETGRFGGGGVLRGEAGLGTAWWGAVVTLGVGAVLAFLLPTARARIGAARLGAALGKVPILPFALALGLAATVLSSLAGQLLFQGLPTLVDGMVSLLQGRMLAGGQPALPLPDPAAAWVIPNTLLTQEGWISQYPPFPSLLLALGSRLGAEGLVQPLLVGVTVVFTVLLADHLLSERPATVRLGGILLASSPFLILLGGGYLSHVPAAAFGAVTLFAALRARDGSWRWALLVGAGAGAAVTSRPWFGLWIGVALPLVLWLGTGRRARGLRWWAARLGAAAGGGTPFALALGLYNRQFFGHPLRLGYSSAFGPAHDLGFHRDPWGNLYGPLEALGFTSLDLVGLSTYLLETPLPALALVGAFLLLSRSLPRGMNVLLAWGLLPVLANVFYWHHGSHLGPRMLYEAAPAWVLLATLAGVGMAAGGREPDRSVPGPSAGPRLHPRDILFWSLLVCLLSPMVLGGMRARSYRWPPDTLARITVPQVPGEGPALVFVHGSWSERVAARLQADGMRLDSIETALRRNDLCALEAYVRARTGAGQDTPLSSPSPALDFQLLAETPAHLREVHITEGNRILLDPSRALSPRCRREAEADRNGIVSFAPLVWQGDLPGLHEGGVLFARDLGWEANGATLAAFPGRRPFVFLVPAPGWPPEVRGYQEGMTLIWGEDAVEAPAPAPREEGAGPGEPRGFPGGKGAAGSTDGPELPGSRRRAGGPTEEPGLLGPRRLAGGPVGPVSGDVEAPRSP